MTDYDKLIKDIDFIKKSILSIEQYGVKFGDWIPKKTAQKFFDYSDTKMRLLEINNSIEVSQIGKRKFYSIKSILELLNKNKI